MLTAAAFHRKPPPLRDGALINKLCPVDDGRAAEQKPIMKKVNVVFMLRLGRVGVLGWDWRDFEGGVEGLSKCCAHEELCSRR